MRKTVADGNGNELCGEGGMGMAKHGMTAENGNGLCREGEWEWQNTEWQPTPYRFNK
jgi:hypothetical protein